MSNEIPEVEAIRLGAGLGSNTIDRRSALKKAAVAGAVAWTAPMVLSQPALAQAATCTPKCATPSFTVTVEVGNFCTSSGSKWALMTVQTSAPTCPCTNAAADVCLGVPSTWDKGNAQDFAASFDAATVNSTPGWCAGVAGSPCPLQDNQFVVKKPGNDGALGDGTYTANQPLYVAQACADRTGDIVWRVCGFTVSFTYSPSSGPCAALAGVGTFTAVPLAGGCTTPCQANCPV